MKQKAQSKKISRRRFLETAAKAAVVASTGAAFGGICRVPFGERRAEAAPAGQTKGYIATREAMYYQKLDQRKVKCKLCPRGCVVGSNERGYCGVRENRNGTYYTLVYGNPCTINVDPLEKKPILHMTPGTRALSVATAGCNLNCKYCQNWQMAQSRPEETRNYELPPSGLVASAKAAGRKLIAFDFTEPVVFYEYVIDTAKLARKAGLKIAVCTAAYIEPEPLVELCKYVDMFKVDLKGIDDEFYGDVCAGRVGPVKLATQILKREGVWFELVNLIVPTKNDKDSQVSALVDWVKEDLGTEVPLTFSRFEPMYQYKNLPPTSVETVERARLIAVQKGLKYVYLGNVPASSTGRNTYCPECGKLLVQRLIYDVKQNKISKGKCPYCEAKIPGIWD